MNVWFFCFWLLLTGTLFSSTHSSTGAWNQDVPLTFTQINKQLFHTKMSNKKSESLICQNVPPFYTLVHTGDLWTWTLKKQIKWIIPLLPCPSNQQPLKEEGSNFSARIWTCCSRESEHFKASGWKLPNFLLCVCVCVCACTRAYMWVGGGAGSVQKRIKSTFNVRVSHLFAYTLEGRMRTLSLQTLHKPPQGRSSSPFHFVSLCSLSCLYSPSLPPSPVYMELTLCSFLVSAVEESVCSSFAFVLEHYVLLCGFSSPRRSCFALASTCFSLHRTRLECSVSSDMHTKRWRGEAFSAV